LYLVSSESITYGRKKLFQLPTKLKKAIRPRIGLASGSAIDQNRRISEAPSMRPAASSSRGRLVAN